MLIILKRTSLNQVCTIKNNLNEPNDLMTYFNTDFVILFIYSFILVLYRFFIWTYHFLMNQQKRQCEAGGLEET